MSRRVNFINPFGTTVYDELILETLNPYCMDGTELVVTHLDSVPADIDYFYPKHLAETAIFEAVMTADEEGYDAAIVGCCYDPGVLVSRELTDMPVVGPMEASLQLMAYHGRTAVIVSDHPKAISLMRDNAKLYCATDLIVGYEVINWYVRDMITDFAAVADDVIQAAEKLARTTGAEALILNCTIIAASYQKYLLEGGQPASIPILNSNLMALMMAETTGHMRQRDALQISRRGFYGAPHDTHYEETSRATRQALKNARAAFEHAFNHIKSNS